MPAGRELADAFVQVHEANVHRQRSLERLPCIPALPLALAGPAQPGQQADLFIVATLKRFDGPAQDGFGDRKLLLLATPNRRGSVATRGRRSLPLVRVSVLGRRRWNRAPTRPGTRSRFPEREPNLR